MTKEQQSQGLTKKEKAALEAKRCIQDATTVVTLERKGGDA